MMTKIAGILPNQDQRGISVIEMTPVALIYCWNVAEKLGDDGESTTSCDAEGCFH